MSERAEEKRRTGHVVFLMNLVFGLGLMGYAFWLALTGEPSLVEALLYLWAGMGIMLSGAVLRGVLGGGAVA